MPDPVATPEQLAALTPHDQAMVAKVDAKSAEVSGQPAPVAADPAKPARPEHIPEKFWDADKGQVKVDELAKSYGELEKGRGKPAAAATPATPPAAADPATVEATAAAAAEAAKAAGADTAKVDFPALTQEYLANGKLSDATLTSLEKAGLGRDVVGAFIAGEEAKATLMVQEAHSIVGGSEKYNQLMDWAGANVPQAEREAFDQAVTASPASRKLAIEALNARFTASMGASPAGRVHGSGGNPDAGAYQSRAEVVADMRDSRYSRDPAFRAKVEAKLANSTVF